VFDTKLTRLEFLKILFWGGTGVMLGSLGFFRIGNIGNYKQLAFADNRGGGGGGDASKTFPMTESQRRARGFEIRRKAADMTYGIEWPKHPNNGEENDYRENGKPTYIANYTKGLPHNKRGEPDREAYRSLLRALESGDPKDFENIEVGNPDPNGLRFFNPQAGLTFTLEGPDPFGLSQPPAPRIDSAEGAAEMAELYWMSLVRDVNFTDFDNDDNKLIQRAAEDLSTYSAFYGPKQNGKVTPDTIFRGNWPGTLKGPYVSQFALLGTKIPAFDLMPDDGYVILGWGNRIDQRILTLLPGSDHLTDFKEWLRVQNGFDPRRGEFCSNEYDKTPRFIHTPRDLANWVQYDDLPSQEFTIASLILLHQEVPCMLVIDDPAAVVRGGTAPFDPGNPYRGSRTQEGFFNFGPFHPLAFVSEVVLRALRAVWFQKWFVHRRLRPEEFGGRIHIQKTGQAEYPIHHDILESDVFDEPQFKKRDSFLLPQVFPQGAPPHPSYGAGHASAVGAMATILKAFFDERFVLRNPVVPNKDGTKLEPYKGSDKDELTVGGELNKLASNVAVGRQFAGVHYRSDYVESISLGEKVAIGILEQQREIYNEDYSFTFTKFNGEKMVIRKR
jgi:hypothetical protein